MSLLILLQEVASIAELTAEPLASEGISADTYFSLVLKGGWIMVPIFLLSILSIYVIVTKWIALNRLGKKDTVWLSRVVELVHEDKVDKALKFSIERPYSSAKVIAGGLKEAEFSDEEIQEAMQVEANQQIIELENQMNWLGITASIAPMMGFLGTIFGVIKIFYDVARTNDLAIDTISTGLYQKMICSGAGLLVGILAYSGYYLLNGRIDKIVANIEKESNEVIKAVRALKRSKA